MGNNYVYFSKWPVFNGSIYSHFPFCKWFVIFVGFLGHASATSILPNHEERVESNSIFVVDQVPQKDTGVNFNLISNPFQTRFKPLKPASEPEDSNAPPLDDDIRTLRGFEKSSGGETIFFCLEKNGFG